MATTYMDLPIESVEVSGFNTRKDLIDGQQDSSIHDLAGSMSKQGLLNPITVTAGEDGSYSIVAGQRRFLAAKRLGWITIPAIVREDVSDSDAVAISLIENVHRADMNPRDKAQAFNSLFAQLGTIQKVSRDTGVGVATVKKYLQLLDLAPELQEKLAAGEAKNTQALAELAQKFPDCDMQGLVWERIGGLRQDVQLAIIAGTKPDLSNFGDLMDRAVEGELGLYRVKNCPFDCPRIPDALRERVAQMIATAEHEPVQRL